MSPYSPAGSWPNVARWFVIYGGARGVDIQNLTATAKMTEISGSVPGRPARSAFEVTLIAKAIDDFTVEPEQPIFIIRQDTSGNLECPFYGTTVSIAHERNLAANVDDEHAIYKLTCSTVYRQMQNTYLPDSGQERDITETAAARMNWLIGRIDAVTPINIDLISAYIHANGITMYQSTSTDQRYGMTFNAMTVADAINTVAPYGQLEWAFRRPSLIGAYVNPPGIPNRMDPVWWPVMGAVSTRIAIWDAIAGGPQMKENPFAGTGNEIIITDWSRPDLSTAYVIGARTIAISENTDNLANQAKVFYKSGLTYATVSDAASIANYGVIATKITSFDTKTREMAESIGRVALATRSKPDITGTAVVPFDLRYQPGLRVWLDQSHDRGNLLNTTIRDVSYTWVDEAAGDPVWTNLTFGSDPYVAPTLPKPVVKIDGGAGNPSIPGINDLLDNIDHIFDQLSGAGNIVQAVASFDAVGSSITANTKVDIPVSFGATIAGWTIVGDGSAVVTVRHTAAAGYPGSLTEISGSGDPTLGGEGYASADTTGWTKTTIAAGDVLRFLFNSGTATRITVSLLLKRT
jgi:hypothetical protein